MAKFLAEKAKSSGADQQLGPLNPYERRLVHMAVAEVPGEERDYLNRAREDYIRAEELYQQTGLFGDVARNEVQAMQGVQRIEQRLSQLDLARTQGTATQ